MQRLRREAGRYVRKDSVTTEMLKLALNNHLRRCRRGNHEIIVLYDAPNRAYPDMELCAECDLYLACQAAGKTQAERHDMTDNENTQEPYPCINKTQRIRFLYHDTCCIEYDVDAHMLTGHGTHGWSQSTNNAIRKYLEALVDGGYFSQEVMYEMLAAVRRDGKGTLDREAPWYSTRR